MKLIEFMMLKLLNSRNTWQYGDLSSFFLDVIVHIGEEIPLDFQKRGATLVRIRTSRRGWRSQRRGEH